MVDAFYGGFRGVMVRQQQDLRARIPVRDPFQQPRALGHGGFHQDGVRPGTPDQIPTFLRFAGRQEANGLRRQRGLNETQALRVPHDRHNRW